MTSLDVYNDNFKTAFTMCFLSGLSTAIGGLYVIFIKQQSHKLLGHLLSFSSGVMIYISFMDLLPESIAEIGFYNANIWFFVGIIFFAAILRFVPHDHDEGDSNHAHSHNGASVDKHIDNNKEVDDNNGKDKKQKQQKQKQKQQQQNIKNKKKNKDSYLNSVGIATAIGVSLHNFPEGVAVYLACLKGIDVGLPLMLAIAAHNIPEGMAVAAPIYSATGSKWKAFKYSLYSGLCEPIGALIFGLIFREYMTPYLIQSMLAAVAGIMVFMVIKELLPAAFKYVSVDESAFSNVLGMIFFFFSIHFLHSMLPHDHGSGGGDDHGHSHGGHGHSHGGHGHSHGGHSHGDSHIENSQSSSFNAFA
ncbi:hypothetical protein RB653_000359 [Dictyostelium firmibasis]|uniref:Zinc/iron permease n=1 Tax=Dictyostelium firmibasis TaxID=79012 RepID=A0AAN7U2L2_9MYCE